MNELYYVYPVYQKNSFHVISKAHISYLSLKVKVQEIDESILDNIMWTGDKSILLHPVGYLLLGDSVRMFYSRIKRLDRLKKVAKRLGGFDTADSDAISQVFVNVLNELDLVIVPSEWAKECYLNSGVDIPIEVLPHGLNSSFLNNSKEITNKTIKELLEIKKKHDARLILFFLWHSGYRKGADIVAQAMSEIQKEHDNVFLVVKTGDIVDTYLHDLLKLKMIHIKGWLSDDELRQLYDVCDVLVCPSRGGGFELNTLEGVSRGLPTLATNGMCFLDYIEYIIPIQAYDKVVVLKDNPIHIGYGYEVDINDFVKKLHDVLDNIQSYKLKFKKYSRQVRRKYAWSVICEKLYEILDDYEFI
ncbi:MAG: hypothetical protein DRP27_05350 [Thermotogae bacterium]|nr:MAG: hypothetical protein DRP27_05350 [Thermotogota bacterium]RLG32348.1 MAG: hypothetical protein DRN97_07575 [Methanosarcinales archaeon]